VQGGADYANFSIGYFQMKPSFVEQLEEFIQADSLLRRKYRDCLFIKPQERAARVTRVDRLITIEWQIKYLEILKSLLKAAGNIALKKIALLRLRPQRPTQLQTLSSPALA